MHGNMVSGTIVGQSRSSNGTGADEDDGVYGGIVYKLCGVLLSKTKERRCFSRHSIKFSCATHSINAWSHAKCWSCDSIQP